jgi:tetratricopeptide (TPR) repeat protein
MIQKTLVVALVLAVATPAARAEDPFTDPLIKQIQERHEKGVQGDKKEVKLLMEDLEKLSKERPGNALIKAYLGSTYTLRSRDVFVGPSKYHYLKEGLKTMDAAVDAAPTDPAVRFIRAVNNFHLPAFCNRRATARNDFQILLQEVSAEKPPDLNTETVQAIYYYAGLSYQQQSLKGEARDTLQRGLDLAPASELAKKIQVALSKIGS